MSIGIEGMSSSGFVQRRCDILVKDSYCFFGLYNVDSSELVDIINFKSWTHSSYRKSYNVRYVNVIRNFKNRNYVVRTSIGFGPLLLRYLRSKGFIVDSSVFNSSSIFLPKFRLTLYDFQRKMVDDWLSAGGIGVIKSPTGSGKTIIGCKIIEEIKKKTLILVHTSDLLTNVWIESLINCFGLPITNKIGIVGGKLSNSDRADMKLSVKDGFIDNIEKDIVIATFQTLNNKLDEVSKHKFGLVMVDECIPLDSEIWTDSGVINLDGLDKDNGIFSVQSGNNYSDIVSNNYNKIKTVYKDMYETYVETGDKVVCSLDHHISTTDGYLEMVDASNVAKSLLRPYDMSKNCILARLFGYLLGDGWISISGGCGAGGDTEGLLKMQNDIKKLNYYIGYGSCNIGEERDLSSKITTESGNVLNVSGTCTTMSLTIDLSRLFKKLGLPVGKRTNQVYDIPGWIMNGSKDIKREFLAGYLGAEGSNPIFRGSDSIKLRKSFYVPRVSLYKREDILEGGLKFAEQLKTLFCDLSVNVSNISVHEGNIRKDGTISKKINITISNEFENLINYLDIGYRYAPKKEVQGEVIRLYLKYLNNVYNIRNEIKDYIIKLYNSGLKNRGRILCSVCSMISGERGSICNCWEADSSIKDDVIKKNVVTITDGIISDILYPHKRDDGTDVVSYRVSDVISFDDWSKKVKGDFIFLDIIRHKYRGYEQGYDLQVNKDHNYLVNGFQIHNCHHAPAEMFRKVNQVVSAPYKCGLSATMKRLDGLEKDCFGQLGDIQSSVPIRELINKGILTEPRFQSPVIVDKDVCESVEKCGYRGLEFSRFVKKKSASSKIKKDFIINICRNVDARNRKFLLFTDYVAAQDVYIRDMYSDTLSKMGVPVNIIDQGMTSEERSSVFNNLENGDISGIVLGKLGSEGVNIPSVNVVIMANALKSPITFTQRVGRAMRSAPGKTFCDVYEVLIDLNIELKWSYFNFQEYRDEGFQKLMYKVE